MAPQRTSAPASSGPTNSVDLDKLNLVQALTDFEVANARVLDLTRRLTTQHEELVRLRNEVSELRIDLAGAQSALGHTSSELSGLQASKAYRTARQLGMLRARLLR